MRPCPAARLRALRGPDVMPTFRDAKERLPIVLLGYCSTHTHALVPTGTVRRTALTERACGVDRRRLALVGMGFKNKPPDRAFTARNTHTERDHHSGKEMGKEGSAAVVCI